MSAAGAVLSASPSVVPSPTRSARAGNGQLVLACLVGIAVIVVLISWLKMHPFLALILGSAALAAVAWIAPTGRADQLHQRVRQHRGRGRASSSP